MSLKAIASFIVGHILLLGGANPPVKPSPIPTRTTPPIEKVTSTTTANTKTITPKLPVKKQTVPKIALKPKSSTISKTPTNTTPKVSSPAVQPQSQTANPTPEPSLDFADINTASRKSIVNILCSTKNSALSPITGTGVVVGPDGLILTNAHIGQYFLLRDFREKGFVDCIARTGSPAYPTYRLELVYISPIWVQNNKTLLKEQNPQGTGENDFAFLRVTGKTDGSTQSTSIPFIPMDIRESIKPNEPVLLASYPAGFLGGLSILQDLNVTTAITKVSEIFTFKETTVDLISVPGTVVSQKGSSGGAVVDSRGHLIGIISTSSEGKETSERDLRAITVAYINRDLKTELGLTLAEFIYQDHAQFAQSFATSTFPTLSNTIIDELMKN